MRHLCYSESYLCTVHCSCTCRLATVLQVYYTQIYDSSFGLSLDCDCLYVCCMLDTICSIDVPTHLPCSAGIVTQKDAIKKFDIIFLFLDTLFLYQCDLFKPSLVQWNPSIEASKIIIL